LADNDLAHRLKQTFIFSDFTDTELETVTKLVKERFYKKGVTIFHEGQPGTAFYVVKTGRIKVYKLADDGRELILGIFSDGALFGDVPIFDAGPYPAGAAAMVDSYVYSIDRDDFDRLIVGYPEIALKVIRVLGKRLRQAHGFVMDMAMKSAGQRLSSVLLKLADDYGVESEEGTIIDLPLTRQEIAELMGVSRETAIRELSRFSRAGSIKLDGKQIILTDTKKLRLWSRM
jgi:CRP/FNR family transcriptional regulator, cyclic AMP receptor protein